MIFSRTAILKYEVAARQMNGFSATEKNYLFGLWMKHDDVNAWSYGLLLFSLVCKPFEKGKKCSYLYFMFSGK